jgi:hypothetical protein
MRPEDVMNGGNFDCRELTLVGAQQSVDFNDRLGVPAGRVKIINMGSTSVVLEGFGDSLEIAANRSVEFSGRYNEVRLNGTGTALVLAHENPDAKIEYSAYTALAEKKGVEYIEQAFDHSEFTAAATSESLAIAGLPANVMLLAAEVDVTELFDGGAITATELTVGVSGNEDAFVDDIDAQAGSGSTGRQNNNFQTNYPYCLVNGAPLLTATATGGNVSTFTQGAVTVRLFYREVG